MRTTSRALLFSAVVASPAFASGYSAAPDAATQTASAVDSGPKTRAEVKAELAQARANGELSLNPNAPAYPQQFGTGGHAVPRTQVTSGIVNAQREGSSGEGSVED
jgi:hypothetical protein